MYINRDNRITYSDDKVEIEIDFQKSIGGCKIKKIKDSEGNFVSGENTKYWWACSPNQVPDSSGMGFSQYPEFKPILNEDFGFSIEDLNSGGLKISWWHRPQQDRSKSRVGFLVNGSYEFPYNSGTVRIWHEFDIVDLALFKNLYKTDQLNAFSANLDVDNFYKVFSWPGNLARIKDRGDGKDLLNGTFSIHGGDWKQPTSSWTGSNCSGPDKYSSVNPTYGMIERNIGDTRCGNKDDWENCNNIIGTRVESSQIDSSGPNNKMLPYLMHYSPAKNVTIARVFTQNPSRRLTMQVFDNSTNIEIDKEYSSGVSWDWGDGNYELWWPQKNNSEAHTPFWKGAPPHLKQGWKLSSTEELWVGAYNLEMTRKWMKSRGLSIF